MLLWSPIRAHAEWLAELREALYGRRTLTVAVAGDDRVCELGRWLATHERRYGHLQAYRDARAVHARFHRRAAYCLELAESGRRTEAIEETGETGELRRLSRLLIQALQSLKREIVRQPAFAAASGMHGTP